MNECNVITAILTGIVNGDIYESKTEACDKAIIELKLDLLSSPLKLAVFNTVWNRIFDTISEVENVKLVVVSITDTVMETVGTEISEDEYSALMNDLREQLPLNLISRSTMFSLIDTLIAPLITSLHLVETIELN